MVTKRFQTNDNLEVNIQLFTAEGRSLSNLLPDNDRLKIFDCKNIESINIPDHASRRLLEQAENYDILGYMEDDIIIEDSEFFDKIRFLSDILPVNYAVLPHRCEWIENKGEVILSGDPVGGRNDLFWDTGEQIEVNWGKQKKRIYRATNPHSGCFFISRKQAIITREFWERRQWKAPYMLSGPLEQAASGRLIEMMKIMKPIPEDYRFLKVRHCDELWKRHEFIDD
ncbi:hypothetical protein FZZ91_01145 [Synechococcus sp. HB1133]|nr:hypothetical protein [Synechococcus sp. HB1133]MCB4431206.1 hypothetical protein [Synechococcus sp. HBA1120]NHI80385.1 hypothetical protein [Synechococcus sp. HB1133]